VRAHGLGEVWYALFDVILTDTAIVQPAIVDAPSEEIYRGETPRAQRNPISVLRKSGE
jgi:hypothetical protein